MKLNALSISEYGVCRNLQIPGLDRGLNLIFGRNGSGKTTLIRFIRNSLYGFPFADQSYQGYLDVTDQGTESRLIRERHSRVMQGDSIPNQVHEEVFDTAFVIDGRSLAQKSNALAALLVRHFHVVKGKAALGNNLLFEQAKQSIETLQSRLEHISRQIAALESERNQCVHQIDREENLYQVHRKELEQGVRELNSRIESIRPSELQARIQGIDMEISTLRLKIDARIDDVPYVSKPYKTTDGLAILYRRLDELDQQIRRWRAVHTDVQQQRISLKEEMDSWNGLTMDSSTHPYHRSRQLLNEIESKLIAAEDTINRFQSSKIDNDQPATAMSDQVSSLCGHIREDLYSLCDELGSQYKSVRHRSATAELKRLRRCYHEIGENMDSLLEHRRVIIEEIRQLDPDGAAAIVRADNEFCSYARHEGYLAARKRYIGEVAYQPAVEVVQPDLTAEKTRLIQLEQQRSVWVRELVGLENEASDLKAQRKAIISELESTGQIVDISEIRSRLESTQSNLDLLLKDHRDITRELEWNKSVRPEPISPILESACSWISMLTDGEIQRAWISNEHHNQGFEVENRFGERYPFDRLGSGMQQQVNLGICLSIIEHCHLAGQCQIVLLDDVFVNLDPNLIESTFGALQEFCNRGIQAIAVTSDQTVNELANYRRVWKYELPLLDLPETSVSPIVPIWRPERSGDLPFRTVESGSSTSHHQTASAFNPQRLTMPQLSMDTRSDRLESSTANFHRTEPRFEEHDDVAVLQLDEPTIGSLNQIGIYSIAQLLKLDPSSISEDSGIGQNEIDRLQAMTWMLICVPALNIEDAQMLIDLGICEPEQLESTHAQQLIDRISRYLNSNDASGRGRAYSRETINHWYDSLGRTRSQWRLPAGYSRRNRWVQARSSSRSERKPDQNWRERMHLALDRERPPRRDRKPSNHMDRPARRQLGQQKSPITPSPSKKPLAGKEKSIVSTAAEPNLKFHLNQSDDLEAAPSIGPKTAERFAKVGVQSVGDFLTQTADSMAEKINYKRITADVIRQWQHQARLVCRIPNLRGHDAQLLVACGIIEPEDLAARSVEKLFAIIQPFSETKEGLKIIRGGKQPDLEEISDWIDWAQQTRSLQAA